MRLVDNTNIVALDQLENGWSMYILETNKGDSKFEVGIGVPKSAFLYGQVRDFANDPNWDTNEQDEEPSLNNLGELLARMAKQAEEKPKVARKGPKFSNCTKVVTPNHKILDVLDNDSFQTRKFKLYKDIMDSLKEELEHAVLQEFGTVNEKLKQIFIENEEISSKEGVQKSFIVRSTIAEAFCPSRIDLKIKNVWNGEEQIGKFEICSHKGEIVAIDDNWYFIFHSNLEIDQLKKEAQRVYSILVEEEKLLAEKEYKLQ